MTTCGTQMMMKMEQLPAFGTSQTIETASMAFPWNLKG
jgi:hypothetical protein